MTGLARPIVFAVLLSCFAGASRAEQTPSLDELLQVIRTNLPTLSPEELNNAAVQGLVHQLQGRIELVGASAAATPAQLAGMKRSIVDGSFVVIRVPVVGGEIADGLVQDLTGNPSSVKTKGVVLDLRFSAGTDYDSAARMAERFIQEARPLLKWGAETRASSAKTNSINLPLAVLVNSETAGSAEALAAVLREQAGAVLIGDKTAGQARLFREYKLSTGQTLRIGNLPIYFAEGKELPASGVEPDLVVKTTPSEERLWVDDPFRTAGSKSGTYTSVAYSTTTAGARSRRTLNEAELVRRHKESGSAQETTKPAPKTPAAEEAPATVQDPCLGRALDLLKGLSLVRTAKPQ